MTNLEQLKKEAREDFDKHFHIPANRPGSGADTDTFLDTLIDHIHAATIHECIDALPKESSSPKMNDRDTAIEECNARLQELITEPV